MQQQRWLPGRFALLFLFSNLAISGTLTAGETAAENHFQKGLFESSLGGGVMFSPFVTGLNRPVVDYTVTEIQLGYMVTDILGRSVWRGNVEIAGSAFGGGIFEGEGSYVSGVTGWLRYNFVPRDSRFMPFVQGGAGLTETDLNRRIEGQNFNFNLNLAAGVRCFVSQNWSVNLEYRYQHISNADMSAHNLGVNAQGPVLSASFFF